MRLGGRGNAAIAAALCAGALLAPAAPAGAIPPGERDVRVLIAKFADDAGYPFTVQEAEDAVFSGAQGSAARYFDAVTGGEVELTNGGISQVDLRISRAEFADCGNPVGVHADAMDQAGVSLSDHAHVIVVAPFVAACPGSGIAAVGPPGGSAPPGSNWVYLNGRLTHNGASNWRLVAHELMHNFGANHAGACKGPFPAGACNGDSYGDPFAIMGASTGALAGFPSAWTQARTGIIGGGQVETASASDVYLLAAANVPAAPGSKLLMVPRAGGGMPFYALETRSRVPYDNFLGAGARLYRGVTVRLARHVDTPYNPGAVNDTQLVAANQSANARNWPLVTCERFADKTAGVKIRPLETGGGFARVQVAVGGQGLSYQPECDEGRALRLAVKPRKKRTRAGANVRFKLTVRNAGPNALAPVRVCVKANRMLRVGKRCKRVSVPGQGRAKSALRVKPKARARGKKVRVQFKANAKGTRAAKARAVLRVRG